MIDEVTKKLQKKLFEMLKWFDAFCRQYELKYYAVGGTLLGAVRHHGFIPWDDDVDIAMPRADYDRFSQIMEAKIHDHYILETAHSDDRDFCFPYMKLYDINTT
jgi:lipopolysaccharide cholinephosphotransferase